MLTWEGQQFSGPQNIVGKFKSLPFQQVQHQVTSMDFQPSMSGGILIQVNGKLMVRMHTLRKFDHVPRLAALCTLQGV